jgi:hypothetical protein
VACDLAHFGPDLLHDMIAGKQETFKACYDDRSFPDIPRFWFLQQLFVLLHTIQ